MSHPLLVVSQQSLLMSCLEHYNLRKEKKEYYEVCTNKSYKINMLHIKLKPSRAEEQLRQLFFIFYEIENDQTLLISVKCLVATTLMSENRAFTSELLWNKDISQQKDCKLHQSVSKVTKCSIKPTQTALQPFSESEDAYFVSERWYLAFGVAY